MIKTKTDNPFDLRKHISDRPETIARQTGLGPRVFDSNRNYSNNLPERNISLAEITKAMSSYRGSTGSGIIDINGTKYLLTEAGLFMLNEMGEVIMGEGL